jgi:hypothetical protein
MNVLSKQEIIQIAESMGFKLDYDKFDDKEYPGDSNNLRYLRFVSIEDDLDEKELRWIWYKKDSNQDNMQRGMHIQSRLNKKRQIIDFLKY